MAAAVEVALADQEVVADMVEQVLLEAVGQEAPAMELALEVGSVHQEMVNTAAEATDTTMDHSEDAT